MRISFFGSSLVSAYWNGACTYYRGLLKEMARLGHTITFYEPDAYDRQAHRDIPDPPWARIVVYPATDVGWKRALEEAAADSDLLVKASGVGVFDAELEEALPQASSRAIAAYWDVDAPATLEAMAERLDHHLHRVIAAYDVVFTYGGGAPVVGAYRSAGARLCVPIYNAVDPDTHYPVECDTALTCDLSFLGNRLPDREARVEEFFFKAASLQKKRLFLLGGSGWERRPEFANVRMLGHVGTAAHNAFFCCGHATLNVNRDSMARVGYSPATRLFEAAGAGACMISDCWEGISGFLEPDREILIAACGEEVAAHLETLDTGRAQTIGRAARRRVLAHHTYAHRARQTNDVLEGIPVAREAAE
jgi:spore maturation protein CgeB